MSTPRFTVGQVVRWPATGRTLRIEGPPSQTPGSPVRWYGGPILSGEDAGGYVLSVPEDQLEAMTPPEEPEGDDAA